MENIMKLKQFELNAGTGMTLGIIAAALISLLVNAITGNGDIWSWSIPVGLAVGLAIGAGRQSQREQEKDA
jgi:hypothetical protein